MVLFAKQVHLQKEAGAVARVSGGSMGWDGRGMYRLRGWWL